MHHERKISENQLGCEQKRVHRAHIMLLIIRHTRSMFSGHYKSKVRAVAFQKENSKSPVDKRLLQQSLTFTHPQKSQLLNPKGLTGQHRVNRNITVRIKTEFLPYAASCRRWGISLAREIRNYSISSWQISWFNRLKANVPVYLRVWFQGLMKVLRILSRDANYLETRGKRAGHSL